MSITIEVPQTLHGERLDRVLPALVPGLSRRSARERITDGSVFVEGRRIRVQSRPVKRGERIEVHERRAEARRGEIVCPPFTAEPGLLVVDKPSGMPTEPTRQASAGSLTHAVREELIRRGAAPRFLAAAHRLDLETSGVVLVATDPEVAAALGAQFASGTVQRRYLALVEGKPSFAQARLDAPIAKERGRDGRYPLTANGRPALTLVTVRSSGSAADAALLEVEPRTGRTHQIRAHLAAAGHPIAGDVRYGGRAALAGQFGLHALTLTVERDGERQVYAAPPPPAFYDLASARGIDRAEVEAAVSALTPRVTPT